MANCKILLPILLLVLPQSTKGPNSDTNRAVPSGVEFRLSSGSSSRRAGQPPICLRAEFLNNAKTDFVVGKSLLPIINTSTYLTLEISDEKGALKGTQVMTVSGYAGPDIASWTRIAPGHFYGIEIKLDVSEYPYLDEPGRYAIKATYVSKGGDACALSRLSSLPAACPVWEGRIISNSIWIEVLPPPK